MFCKFLKQKHSIFKNNLTNPSDFKIKTNIKVNSLLKSLHGTKRSDLLELPTSTGIPPCRLVPCACFFAKGVASACPCSLLRTGRKGARFFASSCAPFLPVRSKEQGREKEGSEARTGRIKPGRNAPLSMSARFFQRKEQAFFSGNKERATHTLKKKNIYTSYSKLSEVKLLTIGIASPLRILQWAEKTLPNGKIYGEVLNANTLHHKTFKPQRGGLFCERIFGPLKDFECACGIVDKSVRSLTESLVVPLTNKENMEGENCLHDGSLSNTSHIIKPDSTSKVTDIPPVRPRSGDQELLQQEGTRNQEKEVAFLSTFPLDAKKQGEIKNYLAAQSSEANNIHSKKEAISVVKSSFRFEQPKGGFPQANIRKFCPICDVEYTWSVIRRYQLGYIKLISPVTHIWFLKGTPSYLSLLLDIKKRHLQFITYCTETLTLENSITFFSNLGSTFPSDAKQGVGSSCYLSAGPYNKPRKESESQITIIKDQGLMRQPSLSSQSFTLIEPEKELVKDSQQLLNKGRHAFIKIIRKKLHVLFLKTRTNQINSYLSISSGQQTYGSMVKGFVTKNVKSLAFYSLLDKIVFFALGSFPFPVSCSLLERRALLPTEAEREGRKGARLRSKDAKQGESETHKKQQNIVSACSLVILLKHQGVLLKNTSSNVNTVVSFGEPSAGATNKSDCEKPCKPSPLLKCQSVFPPTRSPCFFQRKERAKGDKEEDDKGDASSSLPSFSRPCFAQEEASLLPVLASSRPKEEATRKEAKQGQEEASAFPARLTELEAIPIKLYQSKTQQDRLNIFKNISQITTIIYNKFNTLKITKSFTGGPSFPSRSASFLVAFGEEARTGRSARLSSKDAKQHLNNVSLKGSSNKEKEQFLFFSKIRDTFVEKGVASIAKRSNTIPLTENRHFDGQKPVPYGLKKGQYSPNERKITQSTRLFVFLTKMYKKLPLDFYINTVIDVKSKKQVTLLDSKILEDPIGIQTLKDPHMTNLMKSTQKSGIHKQSFKKAMEHLHLSNKNIYTIKIYSDIKKFKDPLFPFVSELVVSHKIGDRYWKAPLLALLSDGFSSSPLYGARSRASITSSLWPSAKQPLCLLRTARGAKKKEEQSRGKGKMSGDVLERQALLRAGQSRELLVVPFDVGGKTSKKKGKDLSDLQSRPCFASLLERRALLPVLASSPKATRKEAEREGKEGFSSTFSVDNQRDNVISVASSKYTLNQSKHIYINLSNVLTNQTQLLYPFLVNVSLKNLLSAKQKEGKAVEFFDDRNSTEALNELSSDSVIKYCVFNDILNTLKTKKKSNNMLISIINLNVKLSAIKTQKYQVLQSIIRYDRNTGIRLLHDYTQLITMHKRAISSIDTKICSLYTEKRAAVFPLFRFSYLPVICSFPCAKQGESDNVIKEAAGNTPIFQDKTPHHERTNYLITNLKNVYQKPLMLLNFIENLILSICTRYEKQQYTHFLNKKHTNVFTLKQALTCHSNTFSFPVSCSLLERRALLPTEAEREGRKGVRRRSKDAKQGREAREGVAFSYSSQTLDEKKQKMLFSDMQTTHIGNTKLYTRFMITEGSKDQTRRISIPYDRTETTFIQITKEQLLLLCLKYALKIYMQFSKYYYKKSLGFTIKNNVLINNVCVSFPVSCSLLERRALLPTEAEREGRKGAQRRSKDAKQGRNVRGATKQGERDAELDKLHPTIVYMQQHNAVSEENISPCFTSSTRPKIWENLEQLKTNCLDDLDCFFYRKTRLIYETHRIFRIMDVPIRTISMKSLDYFKSANPTLNLKELPYYMSCTNCAFLNVSSIKFLSFIKGTYLMLKDNTTGFTSTLSAQRRYFSQTDVKEMEKHVEGKPSGLFNNSLGTSFFHRSCCAKQKAARRRSNPFAKLYFVREKGRKDIPPVRIKRNALEYEPVVFGSITKRPLVFVRNTLLRTGKQPPIYQQRLLCNSEKKTINKLLFNNVYTLSHRERWQSEKDWPLFLLYNSTMYNYYDTDVPIFAYENRLLPNLKDGSLSSSFYSGPGIVKQLIDELNYTEIQKLDKQNRLILYQLNKLLLKVKKQVQLFVFDKTAQNELKELCKKRDLLIRRTKLVRKLFKKDSSPSTMMITILPVLPPDLRPIVKMGSQIAASDLNRLYQRVLYRNERLKKFLKDPATSQSFEMKYAQRLLQESVDNLIQNGKSGLNIEKDSRGRALKSLSDSLKGKQGRFRQFLLGKRVDYSGRSVIVVGPKLKLQECGIPVEMAKELYLPFLLKIILNRNYAKTVIGAKTLIKKNSSLAHELLREILQVSPVLLNRAPTLHRLGFQAFVPKLVEGKAILLHPLVCSAFNADFDGDQMAVHVPITIEARAEAWKLMLSRNNMLSPATGDPLTIPSQDMVLGCYFLTTYSHQATARILQDFNGLTKKAALFRASTLASRSKERVNAFPTFFPKGAVSLPLLVDEGVASSCACFASVGRSDASSCAKQGREKEGSEASTEGRNHFTQDGAETASKDPRQNENKQQAAFFSMKTRTASFYFNNFQDVLKAYSHKKLNLHALIWVKWSEHIENGNDQEEPLEIRLSFNGNWHEITENYQRMYDSKNLLVNQYIATTPGRIIFNFLINKHLF